jgi:hypothetical protein
MRGKGRSGLANAGGLCHYLGHHYNICTSRNHISDGQKSADASSIRRLETSHNVKLASWRQEDDTFVPPDSGRAAAKLSPAPSP